MNFSTNQLHAFFNVAEKKSFSQAAAALGVTQSALSQRVASLEKQVGEPLLLRKSGGLILTEVGWKMFRHCQQIIGLESDLINELRGENSDTFQGKISFMAKATLLSSFLQPTLASFFRKHKALDFELILETDKAEDLLERDSINYFISDQVVERPNIASYVIGQEQFVLVEASRLKAEANLYVDIESDPAYLFSLLKREGERRPHVRRRVFSDFSSMLEGVQNGLGRAVIPRHVFNQVPGLQIVEGFEEKVLPVILNFKDRASPAKFHLELVDLLTSAGERVFASI